MPSLVIQLARLGDLLQTKRLLLSLAQTGETHLLVDYSLADIARLLFPFVTVHAIAAHAGGLDTAGLIRRLPGEIAELREQNFRRVYNLNYSGLNLALSTLWRPHQLCGYRLEDGQEMRSAWLGLAFRWAAQRRSAPLNLMDLWGLLAPSPIEPERVNPKATPKGGGLGVMLAGRMARRSIPPELWAMHIAAVCRRMGWPQVTLFGGKSEQAVARAVLHGLPAAVLAKTANLAGKTGLSELARRVERLDRLLTPDTGGMHLAAHFGVPVEAFFLSSAWVHETGPYGEGHIIWQALSPCLPCLEIEPCPHAVRCLEPFAAPTFLKLLSHFRAGDEGADGAGGLPVQRTEEPGADLRLEIAGEAGRASAREAGLELPAGLLGLQSGFDALGVVYRGLEAHKSGVSTADQTTAEIAPHDQRRAALRRLLADYRFGKSIADAVSEQAAMGAKGDIVSEHQICEQFFRESDWILPEQE